MKENLHRQAWQAFTENDYALAAKYWLEGYSLPDDETELRKIFHAVNGQNEASADSDLCAILGMIALDYHPVFEPDHEQALTKCLDWSILGLEKDPSHYQCSRNAGSALYWLNDTNGALKYYLRSESISPSPVVQIRIFTLRNGGNGQPDFSELDISDFTDSAMEAYNAAVEINHILEGFPGMPEAQNQRLAALKVKLYEHAYLLYRSALVNSDGNVLNGDPHTFAMCCNNLARELIAQGNYQRSIDVASEGMQYSKFLYIILNRMSGYSHAGMPEKAKADGLWLLDEYAGEMDVLTLTGVIDTLCFSCMELGQYEEALEWADEGLGIYHQTNPANPVKQHEEMTRCVTNFFIHRAKAAAALGRETDTATGSEEADHLLEAMPDNPSLMISRADSFVRERQWEKALECYGHAVRFGLDKGLNRSVQVALYNKGCIYEAQLQDSRTALDSFEQSIRHGNRDFWCLYWAMRSAYRLTEDEKTIRYGNWSLSLLPGQEGVADDIVAEIYEYLGNSQLDQGNYEEAVKNLEQSLNLNFSQTASNNLQTARSHAGNKGGFFRRLFRK